MSLKIWSDVSKMLSPSLLQSECHLNVLYWIHLTCLMKTRFLTPLTMMLPTTCSEQGTVGDVPLTLSLAIMVICQAGLVTPALYMQNHGCAHTYVAEAIFIHGDIWLQSQACFYCLELSVQGSSYTPPPSMLSTTLWRKSSCCREIGKIHKNDNFPRHLKSTASSHFSQIECLSSEHRKRRTDISQTNEGIFCIHPT